MSVSLYYTARRARPLDDDERAAIDAAVRRLDTDEFGESFTLYDDPGSGDDPGETPTVLAGATKLPSDLELAWQAVQHWVELTGALRLVLADADWHVNLDDLTLPWDEASHTYRFE